MTCSPHWNANAERLERLAFWLTFRRNPRQHWAERLERLERRQTDEAMRNQPQRREDQRSRPRSDRPALEHLEHLPFRLMFR